MGRKVYRAHPAGADTWLARKSRPLSLQRQILAWKLLTMKVVLFCGGFGMRMREYSEAVPKPMVPIGYRPILWHVMKYYAHYGYKDFILCLGYKADVIKNYFRNYDECLSNDFVLSGGGKNLQL